MAQVGRLPSRSRPAERARRRPAALPRARDGCVASGGCILLNGDPCRPPQSSSPHSHLVRRATEQERWGTRRIPPSSAGRREPRPANRAVAPPHTRRRTVPEWFPTPDAARGPLSPARGVAMKHDRPVSELLDECARSLPEPFTRQDILAWFRRHHPDVPPNTVGARIFGLTDSEAPSRDRFQFGGSRPVLERVGRGVYRRARGRPRQPVLFGESSGLAGAGDPAYPLGDVVLVGSVRSTLHAAAPARELYTNALFVRRRGYAEASGRPWFVLDARWGLVAPEEVIAPSEVSLGEMPVPYRHGWAEFVVGQLAGVMAPAAARRRGGRLRGSRRLPRPASPARPAVERAGATLVDPVDAHSLSETLAWYAAHHPDHVGLTGLQRSDQPDSEPEQAAEHQIDARGDVVLRPPGPAPEAQVRAGGG